jgi:Zn-dependent protease with chaperone function
MDDLVYPRERALGAITLVLGILVWLALILGTFGVALLVLALGFLVYLFTQSALIAHIKGNGVELSATQMPDLHSQFLACCQRLGITTPPEAYLLNGNGTLNAFATRFLNTQYVVLNTDVVDAMDKHVDGVRFYMGHELGHLRMKHIRGHLLRWPVLWLPLLGAAYSRARESTCDRHGLACSGTPEGAARALAALAAGSQRWQQLDIRSYNRQTEHTRGFWMSFHELISAYPWLSKRAARVADRVAPTPPRNGLAYIPAAIVPFAGRLGGGFGFLIMVYIVGVMAAIAIPAYKDYTVRAALANVVISAQPALTALADSYTTNGRIPDSLASVSVPAKLSDGSALSLDSKRMLLTVKTRSGELIFVPSADGAGHISWVCRIGAGLRAAQLPASCRGSVSQ